MKEFILTRPYVMKTYKEPSEKQNLKKIHYSILYSNFKPGCCFVMKRHNEPFKKLRSVKPYKPP